MTGQFLLAPDTHRPPKKVEEEEEKTKQNEDHNSSIVAVAWKASKATQSARTPCWALFFDLVWTFQKVVHMEKF